MGPRLHVDHLLKRTCCTKKIIAVNFLLFFRKSYVKPDIQVYVYLSCRNDRAVKCVYRNEYISTIIIAMSMDGVDNETFQCNIAITRGYVPTMCDMLQFLVCEKLMDRCKRIPKIIDNVERAK